MEQATEKCKMYCGKKNQVYSAMSEELARVYRALGDEEKEDIYLKAAVEGFRECYPPEHPKRIAAEQRLKEHQGE